MDEDAWTERNIHRQTCRGRRKAPRCNSLQLTISLRDKKITKYSGPTWKDWKYLLIVRNGYFKDHFQFFVDIVFWDESVLYRFCLVAEKNCWDKHWNDRFLFQRNRINLSWLWGSFMNNIFSRFGCDKVNQRHDHSLSILV